jgi:hypothetical protein
MLQRIKKLKAQAESAKQIGSLHEAETFMNKAIELMTEYNITLMEVDATEIKQGDEFKNWGYGESISYDDKHQGSEWKMRLMDVITDYNFTSYTYNKHFKTLRVYGRMENVDTTVWLYNFMETGLYNLAQDKYREVLKEKRSRSKQEADLFSKKEAYVYKRDFLLGAIHGIREQLARQREQQQSQALSTLVVYNDKALDKFIKQVNPGIRTGNSPLKTYSVGEGYEHGLEAGLTFRINKPLDNNNTSPKYLK